MTTENNHHTASGHISVGKYLIGFIAAIVLTVLSFGVVALGLSPKTTALIGLVVLAIVQIFVHLYFFLHLNLSKESRWNVIAIGFTALILFIFIAGTVWVMFSLNSRMM